MTSSICSFNVNFASIVDKYPSKVALFDSEGRILTYRKLANSVSHAQSLLVRGGVKPGDTIVALLPNAIETLVIFLACLRGGFTYAPLPCNATVPEISRWRILTKSKVCLVASPVSHSVHLELAKMDWKLIDVPIGGDLLWLGDEILESQDGGRLLVASSGSTGDSKAVVLDADRLWAAGQAFLNFHSINHSEVRFWNYLPMSYLGGLFNLGLIPLAAGGSIFVDEPFSGKTFLAFWATIARFKIDSLWLVPTILRGLLTLAERVGQDMSKTCVERCYLGTAPVSLSEKQKFSQKFGIDPIENYGLSETTFISSEKSGALACRSQGSVGEIVPNLEVKLSQVAGEDALSSEILVRTPFMMLGYLDHHGHVQLPVDENGYFPTGDYGLLLDGQLVITGRRRDIIKKGGILIALREIELLSEGFDSVVEAVAVRVDHSFYGESFILFVKAVHDLESEKNFLGIFSKWLHLQLSQNKWPDRILLVDDFPRTSSGKVQKHLLIAE